MYKTVDSAKLFTTTFTPDKFTHLFSSSQAMPPSGVCISLSFERASYILAVSLRRRFLPRQTLSREGGHWDTLHATFVCPDSHLSDMSPAS